MSHRRRHAVSNGTATSCHNVDALVHNARWCMIHAADATRRDKTVLSGRVGSGSVN